MTEKITSTHLSLIKSYIEPFYKEKDIMHDLSHLERVAVVLDDLATTELMTFKPKLTKAALYFHGIIYSQEEEIKSFLSSIDLSDETIASIIQIAWESQKELRPRTNEGLLLHDAHMLEGGRNFEIIKSLITGSVRGQSLKETMSYIKENLLHKGYCYTNEGKRRYKEMKKRTLEIYNELNNSINNQHD